MREWFENLAQRERAFLLVGAGVAFLIIIWTLVWTPLRSGAFELGESLVEKHRLLANLRRAEALSGASGAGAPGTATQSLVLLVDQTHRDHGLAGTLSRNQPDGGDGIRVTFQGASFDALVHWLVGLQQGHGVVVETASFDGTRQPGIVSATLVLRRS
jgi:type II secretory pathway component PulM